MKSKIIISRLVVVIVLSILFFAYVETTAGFLAGGWDNNTSSREDRIEEIFAKYNIPFHKGKVYDDVVITSSDEKVVLKIQGGTMASDLIGNPLRLVKFYPVEIGALAAYDVQPDGASFAPPAHLSITYDPSKIQEGASEADLLVKMYEDGNWIPLETTIDTSTHTASSELFHFTVFGVFVDKSKVVKSTVVTPTPEESAPEEPSNEPPPKKNTPPEPVFESAVWSGEPVEGAEEEEVEEEPGFEVAVALSAIAVSTLFTKKREKIK